MKPAADIWADWQRQDAALAEAMPDTQDALREAMLAKERLRKLGWREGIYCPKDGTVFAAISWGSTGICRAHYDGEWPDGRVWLHEAGDLWPGHIGGMIWRPVQDDRAA